MPVEVAFAEREDAHARCLPREAKEDFAVGTGDCARAAFNAFFGSIERIRPVGSDNVRSSGSRQALNVANVLWWISARLVRVLTKRTRNEDEIDRAARQIRANQLKVFHLAANDGRAAQALQIADGA